MKSSSRSDCSNYLVCKSSGWSPYTHIIFDHDHCWYTKHYRQYYCHYKAFWWAHTDLLECSPLTLNLCCPISKVTPARTDRAGQWGVLSEKQENTQLDLLRHGAPRPPLPGFYGRTVNKLIITSDCLQIKLTPSMAFFTENNTLSWIFQNIILFNTRTIVVVHSLLITDF